MREMLYRKLHSDDRHKRDLILAEMREDEGITTRVEKRYTYALKPMSRSSLPIGEPMMAELPKPWELWTNPIRPRHFFVRKSRSAETGLELFTYKIVGTFYALRGKQTYRVTYRHVLEMEIGNRPPGTTVVAILRPRKSNRNKR